MAQITNYATLQTEVANVLNRDDLTTDIPLFIQLAESRLNRDMRARLFSTLNPFAVSNAETSLPADFYELQSVEHVGATYFGSLRILSQNEYGEELGRTAGTAGVPVACLPVQDAAGSRLLCAPNPDTSYSLRVQYWAKITPLTTSNNTNRMLTNHPDIYLYASLAETAPFLKDDERIQLWESILGTRLDDLEEAQQRLLYGGELDRRPGRTF
jgi:hypothetical protein